ncbi:hypothetical protein ACPVTF_05775 [Geobacillus icigianus]|uniref:Uncharacterized protein n=1 Tax=Geobacillus subterraneus TaxID=129338 RepID=A0A679FLU3_9BACL|nr:MULTISPECIES: hypothetical protein [Geobacillus]KYD29334.1 hypothetical protein B4113_2145 [Geobacillus sp. B4113_201601]BBW96910.1 hypothetical protein GsuE55_17430 [Geobacillus subterraneus]
MKEGNRNVQKGRQNKVSQEVANPTVSKAEAELAKDSVDTGKQAKKPLITIKPGRTEKALLSTASVSPGFLSSNHSTA